jgi:hypothetical protein
VTFATRFFEKNLPFQRQGWNRIPSAEFLPAPIFFSAHDIKAAQIDKKRALFALAAKKL